MTLAEFLLAKIAEDEAWANTNACVDEHYGTLMAPPRILAECDAKRRIVGLHDLTVSHDGGYDVVTGERWDEAEVSCSFCGWAASDESSGCETLRLLALPYADHEAYRQEWKP